MAITRDQIQDYFERYLFDHLPYRDDELYGIILRYLLDVYIDQIYNQVPGDLKLLVENKEVPESLIDHILVSAGLPQDLLDNLTYSDKSIILKCYGDLARIKGSVSLFYRIARDLNEPLGIYELLITRKEDDWVFVAKKIYEHESISPSRDGDVISYDDVYQRVPELLVDKTVLDSLYNNGQLVLPLQSHIILFVTQNVRISVISDLIFVMYYTIFRNIVLLFTLEGYDPVNITLLDLVLAVWYLNTKRGNLTYHIDPRIGYVANISTFDALGWNTEEKFKDLVADYKGLTLATDPEERRKLLDNFTDKWLTPLCGTVQELDVNSDDIYVWLSTNNNRFAEILKDIVVNHPDRIDDTLEQLFTCFLASQNPSSAIYNKYKYLFASILFGKAIQPDKMSTYAFFYHMKPYHVMLLTDTSMFTGVLLEDPFDSLCLVSQIGTDNVVKFLSSVFQIDQMQLCVNHNVKEFLMLTSSANTSDVITSPPNSQIPFSSTPKLAANLCHVSVVNFLTSRNDYIVNKSYEVLCLASWARVELTSKNNNGGSV